MSRTTKTRLDADGIRIANNPQVSFGLVSALSPPLTSTVVNQNRGLPRLVPSDFGSFSPQKVDADVLLKMNLPPLLLFWGVGYLGRGKSTSFQHISFLVL